MKQEKLKQVLAEHKLWLDRTGGERADLSDANLENADLEGADLRGANLRRANLSYANLSDANLSDANLSDANLKRANLRRATLRRANLIGATLSGANLKRANLKRANLSDADLRDANLEGTGAYYWVGSKHSIIYHDGVINIGCESHTVLEWCDNYEVIGEIRGYSKAEIKEYGKIIMKCYEVAMDLKHNQRRD